jgi:hypothetical protein
MFAEEMMTREIFIEGMFARKMFASKMLAEEMITRKMFVEGMFARKMFARHLDYEVPGSIIVSYARVMRNAMIEKSV